MPTSNSSFNSGPRFPLVLRMHIFMKKRNQQLIWNNHSKWYNNPITKFFFSFKGMSFLKQYCLSLFFGSGSSDLEFHSPVQSLLLFTSSACCELGAWFTSHTYTPSPTQWGTRTCHTTVWEVKCREELCINPTVWGGLVLFWIASFLPYRFLFLSLRRQTLRRRCITATSSDPSSLCYIFSICTVANE